jgi:regulator of protease activity HflC (stomatin/prohibitin superfamily)
VPASQAQEKIVMSILYTVPQSCCVLVERLGKFARVGREGLRFKLPLIEEFVRVPQWGKYANRYGWLIELTEQQTDTPIRECQTRDNVDVRASASVFWQIVDPAKAVYATDNLPAFVQNVGLNALRTEIGRMELDQVFSERQALTLRISQELEETAAKWGIRFTRVEIQELTLRDETAAAMRQQMEAERKRRATIAESEGRAQAEVRLAQAEKESAILRAEGRAQAMRTMAEAEADYLAKLAAACSPAGATRLLIAQKALDSYEAISRNPANKVFLPNSPHELLRIQLDDSPAPRA